MTPVVFHHGPVLAPSLISVCDLCDLAASVQRLEQAGVNVLHVDLLDGYFSPSMPLGLDTIRQLRKRTSLAFDCHVMAVHNEFFLRELLDIGVQQLVFHLETEPHPDYWLNEIRRAGVRAGLALKPGTPLTALDYLLEKCDVAELMLINPGFASSGSETQVPYAARKIRDLRAMITSRGLPTQIEIDGRISADNLRAYGHGDVDVFVAGSTCLRRDDLQQSVNAMLRLLEKEA